MQNGYVENLRRKMAQRRVQAIAKQSKEPAAVFHLRVLREWAASAPPVLKAAGLPIETICAAAFAHEARTPAFRFAAQALRQIGWVQRRDYSRAGRNRRYWRMPIEST